MSVLIETSVGSFTVDLYTEEVPAACKNFLKLCKAHYFHGCLFFNVQPDFIAQTGDPTGTGRGGSSLNGLLYGEQARFMDDELRPQLRHNKRGKLSFVRYNPHVANSLGSQWIITLRDDCSSMDDVNTVFGEVVDGWDTIDKLNAAFCDDAGRPLVDVRIKHTYALLDPFDDPPGFDALMPDGGASPTAARPAAETVPARLSVEEAAAAEKVATDAEAQAALAAELAERDTHSKAVVLEMIGDLPDADVAPPDTTLFVCKLNPVTRSEDLEIIFGRFGDIRSCEVMRDRASGDSLGYAFIEFATAKQCEAAYFKMNNVLIDERRIRVDFSQSVSRLWNQYRRHGARQDGRAAAASVGQTGTGAPAQHQPRYHQQQAQLPTLGLAGSVATPALPAVASGSSAARPAGGASRWGPAVAAGAGSQPTAGAAAAPSVLSLLPPSSAAIIAAAVASSAAAAAPAHARAAGQQDSRPVPAGSTSRVSSGPVEAGSARERSLDDAGTGHRRGSGADRAGDAAERDGVGRGRSSERSPEDSGRARRDGSHAAGEDRGRGDRHGRDSPRTRDRSSNRVHSSRGDRHGSDRPGRGVGAGGGRSRRDRSSSRGSESSASVDSSRRHRRHHDRSRSRERRREGSPEGRHRGSRSDRHRSDGGAAAAADPRKRRRDSSSHRHDRARDDGDDRRRDREVGRRHDRR